MPSLFDEKQLDNYVRREKRMARLKYLALLVGVAILVAAVVMVGLRVYHNLWP